MKEHFLYGIHKLPKSAEKIVKKTIEKKQDDKFDLLFEKAKLEKNEIKKIALLSKAYQNTNDLNKKILIYKQGKGELSKDMFFTNIKNDLLKTKSIETLNYIFWKGGKMLSNEAAQKLEKLGHSDNCKCEICNKYHKKEITAIKTALTNAGTAKKPVSKKRVVQFRKTKVII